MTRARIGVIPANGVRREGRSAAGPLPRALLPVGGYPAIDWVLNEAAISGLEELVVVSSPLTAALDAYLAGERSGSSHWPEPSGPGRCALRVLHQAEPGGFESAIALARRSIGDEPLAVLDPSEVLLGGGLLLASMLEHHARLGNSVLSLQAVRAEEIPSNDLVEVLGQTRLGAQRVVGCVDGPTGRSARSGFALRGRFVLDADVLDELNGDDARLTTAIDVAARGEPLSGLEVFPIDGRFDVGCWRGWEAANDAAFDWPALFEVPLPSGTRAA